MLLRNGYKYLVSKLINESHYVTYKNTSGGRGYTTLILKCIEPGNNLNSSSSENFILQLGSGTTKETFEDYVLENPIQNDLFTNQSAYRTINEEFNKNVFFLCVRTVQNAFAEPITVSEVGILNKDCLVTRTVLDEPVVIQPGEFATFTETIEMPE